MLIEVSVENFLSFKEKVIFSMLASNDDFNLDNLVTINSKRILKTSVLYGANASGKTNLLKAFGLLSNMLRNSNNVQPNDLLPIVPFKFNLGTLNKPSKMDFIIMIGEIKYAYGFSADKNKIYEEYLYSYPNNKQTLVFERKNINEYKFNTKDLKVLNDIKTKNTDNKFFLATATAWNYKNTAPVYNWFIEKLIVLLDHEQLSIPALNMYESTKHDKKTEELILNFLNEADFNISGYKIDTHKITGDELKNIPEEIRTFINKESIFTKVRTTHTILEDNKEQTFSLDLEEESLGTQSVFMLLPFIIDALNNGKILLIDELDRSLHPLLIKYIVEIFNNKELNKTNAQLIFNTHDTNLLSLNVFRRDQIWFAEKDIKTSSTDLYPLDDFSVRKEENFEKGYLNGRYGAIPFINEGLKIWPE